MAILLQTIAMIVMVKCFARPDMPFWQVLVLGCAAGCVNRCIERATERGA